MSVSGNVLLVVVRTMLKGVGGGTVVMDIQAGNNMRGSTEAPDKKSTEEVRYAISPLVARRRMSTAGGL